MFVRTYRVCCCCGCEKRTSFELRFFVPVLVFVPCSERAPLFCDCCEDLSVLFGFVSESSNVTREVSMGCGRQNNSKKAGQATMRVAISASPGDRRIFPSLYDDGVVC